MNRFVRSFLLIALCAVSVLIAGCGDEAYAPKVRVMLAEGEGYSIVSENPVFVAPGEDAVFTVALPEGYVCLSRSPGTEFDASASTLTLSDVHYPATVTMTAGEPLPLRKFFLENQGGGRTRTDTQQGLVRDGTVVTVSAEPQNGYTFLGWTLSRTFGAGGELLSTALSYTHTVTDNTILFANFAESSTIGAQNDGTMLFVYDANGGTYAKTGAARYMYETKKYHIYENSLPAKGYFVREGYQLVEYNTKPDGTGETVCPGSKIIADKDEEPFWLYCIWAKETDASAFTYTVENGSAVITGYSGNDEMLVIPAKLGGKPVTIVRSGALQAKNAHTIALPEPIRTVEKGAVVTSGKFTKIYIHDTVTKIAANSFTDLSGMSDVRLIAAHAPAFTTGNEGNFSVKWERLLNAKREGRKVLVVVSGSSSYYGLNSKLLEERLGGEYVVVNYGTNAGTPSTAYMEMISHFVTEGDVVVHAPELNTMTMGSTAIPWKLFRATEYYFNFWTYLDMRNYTGFFSALTELNTYRTNAKLDYTRVSSSLTEYGEHTNTTKLNAENYHAGSNIQFRAGQISGENRTQLNAAYRRLLDKGVHVYMSCAPCNLNAVNKNSRSAEAQDAYMKSIAESVIVPVISHIKDYILPPTHMYNSDYHPNAVGRDMRTNQLAEDLLAYWAKK